MTRRYNRGMAGTEETEFYEGGPTVDPEPSEDDWFATAQMGKVAADPNNDLREDGRGAEIEQP